jgi:hypothetical protein
MRKKMLIIGLMLLPAVGCSSMNNTEKGLLGGSAVGAGIGALATRGSPAGALVGGALGAMVGGVAGSGQDRREDHRAAVTAVANAQARNQMKLHEIIQMTQSNVGDETIIRQMDATGSCFQLSSEDIIELRQQGVSGRVINEMQARRSPRPVVIHQPVVIAPPPPPVYYEPAPVSVGIGVRGRF